MLTGLSGSGKLPGFFDIFFRGRAAAFHGRHVPGARQFTEQLESPDIDRLTGLPPRWLLNRTCPAGGHQIPPWETSRKSGNSCVCCMPSWGRPTARSAVFRWAKRSESEVVELVARELKKTWRTRVAGPLVRGRKGHYADLARWAEGKGYEEMWVDGKLVSPEADFSRWTAIQP